jgi:hypothetical protein
VRVSGHGDVPDSIVARAQDYDGHHFREDGAQSWGRVPEDQVRRLLWGALEAWRELWFVLLPAEAGTLTVQDDGSEGM